MSKWTVRTNTYATGTAYVVDDAGKELAFCQTVEDAERFVSMQASRAELAKALEGLTVDGYGVFDDPRGQRWRLSLPITPDEQRNASIASKRAQIDAALADYRASVGAEKERAS